MSIRRLIASPLGTGRRCPARQVAYRLIFGFVALIASRVERGADLGSGAFVAIIEVHSLAR